MNIITENIKSETSATPDAKIHAINIDGSPEVFFSSGQAIEVSALNGAHPILESLGAPDIWQLAVLYAQMAG